MKDDVWGILMIDVERKCHFFMFLVIKFRLFVGRESVIASLYLCFSLLFSIISRMIVQN